MFKANVRVVSVLFYFVLSKCDEWLSFPVMAVTTEASTTDVGTEVSSTEAGTTEAGTTGKIFN